MRTPINLLISLMIILLMSISLSSQDLDCSEQNEIIKEAERAYDNCYKELGHEYLRCKEQMAKEKQIILKQQKLIDDLENQLGKDAMKHRAQGAGGSAILFILLILFL